MVAAYDALRGDERDPRRELFDVLHMLAINAEIGQRFLQTRDDVGLVHAIVRLRGHTVQAIGLVKEIADAGRRLPTPADVTFVEQLSSNAEMRGASPAEGRDAN